MPRNTERRKIRSVQTSCEIIRTVQERNEVTVSELSEVVNLSAGTVHTHLSTLKDYGLVVQRGTAYRLGPQLIPLGEHVRHHSKLYRAAKPEVDNLADETNECVHLAIENNGQSLIVYEAFGDEAVGTRYHSESRGDSSAALHYRAAGKAIIAHLSEKRVTEIIDEHGLQAATDKTITDRETLLDELAETRSRGYSLNDEEELRGIRAVGAPLLDEDGTPLGAISISGPESRFRGQQFHETLPERLMNAANIIEVNYQIGELIYE